MYGYEMYAWQSDAAFVSVKAASPSAHSGSRSQSSIAHTLQTVIAANRMHLLKPFLERSSADQPYTLDKSPRSNT